MERSVVLAPILIVPLSFAAALGDREERDFEPGGGEVLRNSFSLPVDIDEISGHEHSVVLTAGDINRAQSERVSSTLPRLEVRALLESGISGPGSAREGRHPALGDQRRPPMASKPSTSPSTTTLPSTGWTAPGPPV
jgi:hypothetical protein